MSRGSLWLGAGGVTQHSSEVLFGDSPRCEPSLAGASSSLAGPRPQIFLKCIAMRQTEHRKRQRMRTTTSHFSSTNYPGAGYAAPVSKNSTYSVSIPYENSVG